MVYFHALSHHDKQVYNRAIRQSHQRRIKVHLETLDGDPVGSLTPRFLSGSVAHDAESDVSNAVLTMTFMDPHRVVNFEPSNPGGHDVHRKYRLRITDSRLIADLDRWVDHDVHCGPVWDFTRQGALCTVTAHSVDRLARGTVRKPRAWRRKTLNVRIIRELLQAAGAVDLRIPALPHRTPKVVTAGFAYTHHKKHVKGKKGHKGHDVTVTNQVPRTDHYLEKAAELADAANTHLFADTDGYFVVRHHPERPRLNVGPYLVGDEPQLTRPGKDSPNVWIVTGGKPKGHKTKVHARVALQPSNDLSASALAWNGKPYEIEERVDNPHLKRDSACVAVGRRHRDRAARNATEIEFDMLPVPWLTELDMLLVPTIGGNATMILKQWTYPLGSGEAGGTTGTPMHVGSTVRPRPVRKVHSAGIG